MQMVYLQKPGFGDSCMDCCSENYTFPPGKNKGYGVFLLSFTYNLVVIYWS